MGRSGVWASSDDSSRMALTMPDPQAGTRNAGPHLPKGPGRRIAECFRCSEDRRILRLYTVRWNDIEVGGMLLCDLCRTVLLPLNPDPLDVTTAA